MLGRFGRIKQTMREIIVERIVLITRRRLAHEIIVVVSTDDAVDKRRALERSTATLTIIAEMQRDTAVTCQSIKLSDRTMREFRTSTNQANAISGRIGDLGVADSQRALASIQPMSTDIMNQRIRQRKFLYINR